MVPTWVLALTLMTVDAASSPPVVTEDVPVPGGLAALAQALEIEPLDRGLAIAQLSRLAFEPDKFQRLIAHLESSRRARIGAFPTDVVPLPLSASIWSDVIFKRSIAREDLFAAVLSDKQATLLARGFTALDDETLAYIARQPALLSSLYHRHAAAFAGFATHLRIHDSRIVSPGGDQADVLWESVVGERVGNPERFIRALLETHKGRIAYLYDVIGHLAPDQQRFALGLWLAPPARVQRFQALASVAVSAFSHWDATKSPFTRPVDDLVALFMRVLVTPDGAPAAPAARSLWAAVFEHGSSRQPTSPIDAAWLAEVLLTQEFRDRSTQIDQLGFGQRLVVSAETTTLPDAIYAIRALPTFRALLLTLERHGVGNPAVHAAVVRHAERIAALDVRHQRAALAQFQGSIALIARMQRVGTIDVRALERLLASLAALPLDPTNGYRAGLAAWLDDVLLPALGSDGRQDARDLLLDALSGKPAGSSAIPVTWEGQNYSFDLAAAERHRIARALDRNPEASVAGALHLYRSAKTRPVSGPSAERIDAALADALLVLAYAIDWSDPQGLGRVIRGTVAPRHDFGLGMRTVQARARTPWAIPRLVFDGSTPWHLEGSILALDLVLSSLALRRVHDDPPNGPPTINDVDRDAFIASFGLMNVRELHDSNADAMAAAIGRGQDRIDALTLREDDVKAIVREIRMDGWRARAFRWSLANDKSEIPRLFSMTELLHLGGGTGRDVDGWGMSSLALISCLCSRLAQPGVESAVMGRPQLGVLSSTVADLHLRVVVTLRDLGLPASLAKTVLAGALREFLDRVRPLHHDDWLTLVRTAQRLPRERIEDYVATATAGGPLLPADQSGRARQ